MLKIEMLTKSATTCRLELHLLKGSASTYFLPHLTLYYLRRFQVQSKKEKKNKKIKNYQALMALNLSLVGDSAAERRISETLQAVAVGLFVAVSAALVVLVSVVV